MNHQNFDIDVVGAAHADLPLALASALRGEVADLCRLLGNGAPVAAGPANVS